MITDEEKQSIVRDVIAEISKKYVLTEKEFNLPSNKTLYQEFKAVTNLRHEAFVENVIIQTAKYYHITSEEIKNEAYNRRPKYLKMRRIIAHICRDLPEEPISYEVIAKCLKKDHASIIHGIGKFESEYRRNTDFRLEYTDIKQMVEQSLKL